MKKQNIILPYIVKGVLVLATGFGGGFLAGKAVSKNAPNQKFDQNDLTALKTTLKEEFEKQIEDKYQLVDLDSYSIELVDKFGDNKEFALKVFLSASDDGKVKEYQNLFIDVGDTSARNVYTKMLQCCDDVSYNKGVQNYMTSLGELYVELENAVENSSTFTIQSYGSENMFEARLKDGYADANYGNVSDDLQIININDAAYDQHYKKAVFMVDLIVDGEIKRLSVVCDAKKETSSSEIYQNFIDGKSEVHAGKAVYNTRADNESETQAEVYLGENYNDYSFVYEDIFGKSTIDSSWVITDEYIINQEKERE